jgi:hypothetical protein
MRAKLSVKGGASGRLSCMALGGVLVTASPEEPFVRCWEVWRDEAYTLALAAPGRSAAAGTYVSAASPAATSSLYAARSAARSAPRW